MDENVDSSPHFNLKPHCFDTEMLQEFLFCAAEKNKDLLKNYNPLSGFFKRSSISVFMITISDKLGLNTEGKFLALELFDKFMTAHLKEIHNAILKSPNKDWTSTIQKVKNQTILRALSCIQISNKLSSNKFGIKCAEIKHLLLEMGYNYNLDSILNSELRVLKYLDYKLSIPTPYQFMEILLEILGHNLPMLEPKAFFIIGVKILECFYCSRDQVYDRLYESFTGRTRDIGDRESFLCVENDLLYLSSSLIVASAHIYDPKDKKIYDTVLDAISTISQLEKNDLDEFSVILCHFGLVDDSSND